MVKPKLVHPNTAKQGLGWLSFVYRNLMRNSNLILDPTFLVPTYLLSHLSPPPAFHHCAAAAGVTSIEEPTSRQIRNWESPEQEQSSQSTFPSIIHWHNTLRRANKPDSHSEPRVSSGRAMPGVPASGLIPARCPSENHPQQL